MMRRQPEFPHETDPAAICPACGTHGLHVLYKVDRTPVQSNLLMRTREEALALPRGTMRLGLCRVCGFLANLSFRMETQELSAHYEASQGFSGTFHAFARALARRWSDTYQLAGKTALEIGCGKGEFITLLCEAGRCSGIGFDPTLDPARLPAGAAERVRFVPEFYSEAHADLAVDFICCRHTLEHIPDVRRFVTMLRRIVGDRQHIAAGFEVPDTMRVLREGAFWDIYYEHCSYFTAGSLARLFRLCGFELLDLRAEFDRQYLVLEARPVRVGAVPTLPASTSSLHEEDPAEVAAACEVFVRACQQSTGRWLDLIDTARTQGRRVAVWGSGSKAVGFLTTLGIDHDTLPFVVDINPHKHGTFLPGGGQEIVAPAKLTSYQPHLVIAMNPIYREEIARDLKALGVNAALVCL